MEFAEKLIALRKSRELTQEQLAEQLNVSRQSISKWESGVSHSLRYHTQYHKLTLKQYSLVNHIQ